MALVHQFQCFITNSPLVLPQTLYHRHQVIITLSSPVQGTWGPCKIFLQHSLFMEKEKKDVFFVVLKIRIILNKKHTCKLPGACSFFAPSNAGASKSLMLLRGYQVISFLRIS